MTCASVYSGLHSRRPALAHCGIGLARRTTCTHTPSWVMVECLLFGVLFPPALVRYYTGVCVILISFLACAGKLFRECSKQHVGNAYAEHIFPFLRASR